MKDRTLFISSVIAAFIFGSLTTYLFISKQQMDEIMQAKQQLPISSPNDKSINQNNSSSLAAQNLSSDNLLSSQQVISDLQASNNASINDYSQQQALDIVNTMPDYVLGQYVDKFMAKGDSEVITDKRRFAERAVEELYNENDNQPLAGEVKLGFGNTMPATSVDTSTIDKNAKIFAHLDTNGKVPASPFVFVKWVNNQTGQVLLFEKKDIVANSNQNWVSFRPYEGWIEGSYDIKFYQFSSELEPIAQLTYQIYTVNYSQLNEEGGVSGGTASATVGLK